VIKFGTDGVRGIANEELTPEDAFLIGRTVAYILGGENADILIGKDTRISGGMLESALVSGICSVGANAHIAGVIPTPAIATLVKNKGMNAGIMISASHNPVEDNGIKIFNSDGYKLPDETENQIIDLIKNKTELPRPIGKNIGTYYLEDKDTKNLYTKFLKSTVPDADFTGLKVGIDCANGATYDVAPEIIKSLGADVYTIHNNPNGININKNCGSTYMDSIVSLVHEKKLDIGIAFDGDGDRCLVVDSLGNILCGDQIMSIFVNILKNENKLSKNTLVATVMSNIGLKQMGEKNNIEVIHTNVGDRYVLEKMLECGYNFGGEQSGHFIFLDYSTTGDGILTALQLLKIISNQKKPLYEINKYIKIHPQITVNAKVLQANKQNYMKVNSILDLINSINKKYKNSGRLMVRPSGTENIVRVTIEGEDIEEIEKDANKIKDIIEKELS